MKQNYSIPIRGSLIVLLLLCCVSFAIAQKKITGKVIDAESGSGLPGASVTVKGTGTGATTDANGIYSINAPNSGGTLVFSFVGYTNQEIAIGNKSTIDVTLASDTKALEEVVVTGYAAQQKKNITGSVVVVDTKEMTKFAASNFADQLQGKVAGVQMSTTGDPGSSAFVRIRGIGTINNNEPLYVIDGIPVQNEANLNFLNPSDIESMQVLKDAASASIYGSRAANGVVVITTKKGKAGASKLNIDIFTGTQNPAKFPEMLNPNEFLEVQQKLASGQGIPFASNIYIKEGNNWVLPDFAVRGLGGFKTGAPEVNPDKYYLNPDPTGAGAADYLILQTNKAGTDWFREVFKPAPMTNVQVSASGGSEKGNFYISGNVYDHNGIMIYNEYKRYQVRANSVFNIKKNIRLGQELNIAYQTTRGSVGNPNESSPLIGTFGMPQLVPVYDIKGNFASPANFNANVGNPVSQQARTVANTGHSMRLVGGFYGEVDLTDYLTFQSKFGLDYNSGPSQGYGYRRYDATEGNTNPNSISNRYYLNRNWVFFNTLRFNKTFGNHNVSALAGIEAKENFYEGFGANGTKLVFGDNPNYRLLNNVDPKTLVTNDVYRGEHRVQSQFIQGNYTLSDKYIAGVTVRRDGSSRFINNKWGVFPSGSLGWRISKEAFMQNLSFLNDLKLRASYGILGNNEVGGDYPGYSNYGTSPGNSSYDLGGTATSSQAGFEQTSTGNPDLKWESTAITNIGFDAQIMKAIDVSFEWYSRQTRDMLYNVELPLEGGEKGRQAQNIGSMSNKGIDFQLGYKGKAASNQLSYNVSVSGSTFKNEVILLEANENTFIRSAGSRIGDRTITKAGLPISQFYGYIVDGIWKSEAELKAGLKEVGDAKVGRFKYRDLNNDGKIDNADETELGSPLPKFLLGLNIGANYKNFDFTALLNGVYGNKLFNYVKYFSHFNAFQRNRSKDFLYEAGKTLPVIDGSDNYSAQRNSYYIEDGSYTRLRNLQVGYTLPITMSNKVGMSKLRVYVQGQNLLTFTKYSGLDPDVTIQNVTEGFNSQRDLSLGIDEGRYPWARTFIIGANIEF